MHISESGTIAAVEISRVHKSFVSGIPVLNNINLRVSRGEMVALIGASGSGKVDAHPHDRRSDADRSRRTPATG